MLWGLMSELYNEHSVEESRQAQDRRKKQQRREMTDAFSKELEVMSELLDDGIDEYEALQTTLGGSDTQTGLSLSGPSVGLDPFRAALFAQSSRTIEQQQQELRSQGKHADAEKLGEGLGD